MEKIGKLLPFIAGSIVALAVFFVSRQVRKSNGANQDLLARLEKAREAKLAKSIYKKQEENEDKKDIPDS
jgi:preprotein translocase subunit YajC